MPVTPARVSDTRTRGAEACTSCRSATSSPAEVTPGSYARCGAIDYSYRGEHDRTHLPQPAGTRLDLRAHRRARPRRTRRVSPKAGKCSPTSGRGRPATGRASRQARSRASSPWPDRARSTRRRSTRSTTRSRPSPPSRTPSRGAALRRLFREGDVRVRIDGLRERLSAESPPARGAALPRAARDPADARATVTRSSTRWP